MKPILVFDFDGVICDSFEAIRKALNHYAPWLRYNKISEKELLALKKLSTHEILTQTKIGYLKLPLVIYLIRRKLSKEIESLEPAAGIPELLAELKREGYPLRLLTTNTQANVQRFLRKHHLEYFDEVLGKAPYFAKAPLLQSMQAAESAPVVYVGDEERDVKAAKEAGVVALAVGWGFHDASRLEKLSPHTLVKAPSEIAPWLRRYYAQS
jgi:phosphoglycolate phosphatase